MKNQEKIFVIGHKNPDTDSICSAIAYADIKNRTSQKVKYVPKRAGQINEETEYVLNRFGMQPPGYLSNIGTQVKDMDIRVSPDADKSISLKNAWDLMMEKSIVSLPIKDKEGQLEGLITIGDIAKTYMDTTDSYLLSRAKTQYKRIAETIAGTVIEGNEHGYFVKGKVVVGIGTPEVLQSIVEDDDLVIIGDREDAQLICIEQNCSCLIVTNGFEISQEVLEAANAKDVVVISTPYDTFTVSRLINQSMPIKFFMTKENIVHFELDDYVDDVRDTVAKIRHRDFPIVDENQNYVGMFSRRNLMNTRKKQVILVDHNEKSQAVTNIDEAEILEIIDHHRIGSLETMAPVYFRNQPLGCTGTIIYQMYQEKGVEVSEQMAGLMCAAILSDTLVFRSPTCTAIDKSAAKCLAEIAGIDIDEFAQKMFEAGSDFSNKTEDEILNQDFKIFHSGDYTFGVSQISALARTELDKVQARITPLMEKMQVDKKIDMYFVMLTDILDESTYLIYTGQEAAAIAASAYSQPQNGQGLMLKGVVSRKKQLIPELINAINERA